MKILKRENRDPEWLKVTLRFKSSLPAAALDTLSTVLSRWFKRKARHDKNAEHYGIGVDDATSRRAVQLRLQWIPEEWFESLARALEREFPSLTAVEIGEDLGPMPPSNDVFIEVPRKSITMETGEKLSVRPFLIAKWPISVAQYSRFVEQTGYTTIAEQNNDEYSFRDNPCIWDVSEKRKQRLPACFVSYLDAVAYCKWAGVRLPSEPEWRAAAIVDERVYGEAEVNRRRNASDNEPRALAEFSHEITSTLAEPGKVVLRGGPYLVRSREDLTATYFRTIASIAYYEMLQFRVCKGTQANT